MLMRLIVNLQVAVPPRPRAMNWFCSQPSSSAVFPLFFLSKESDNLVCKSVSLSGTRGVFGAGAAVRFMHPSSSTLGGRISCKRLILLPSSVLLQHFFSKFS